MRRLEGSGIDSLRSEASGDFEAEKPASPLRVPPDSPAPAPVSSETPRDQRSEERDITALGSRAAGEPPPEKPERPPHAPVDDRPPAEVSSEAPAGQRSRLRRRSRFALGFTIGAIATSFLSGFGHDVYRETLERLFESKGPPSLESQVDRIVSQAAHGGYRLVGSVQLASSRPAGDLSRVMLFRPIDPAAQKSDDLRVYDLQRGRLKLEFEFRPEVQKGTERPSIKGEGATPSSTDQLAFATPKAFVIRIRVIRDLNAASGDEAVLDVSESAVKPIWPRPFYLYWDSFTQRFRIEPLLSPRTTHRSTMADAITTRYLRPVASYATALRRAVYLQPLTITGATKTPPMRPFAVEAYVLRRERIQTPQGKVAGGLILKAGYIVRDAGYTTADLLQIVTWHVDLLAHPIRAQASVTSPRIVKVGTATAHLNEVLAEHS
jgi:hypothetical protein